jgi:hypothetical protein
LFEVPTSLVGRYSWVYLSPLIVFALGLALEAFDSAVRAVQLLTAFAHTPQPADRFITYTPLGHTAITLLWHVISHGQWMSIASTASTFIVAVIKVVIAGLFVPRSVSIVRDQKVALNSSFDGAFRIKHASYVDDPFGAKASRVSSFVFR